MTCQLHCAGFAAPAIRPSSAARRDSGRTTLATRCHARRPDRADQPGLLTAAAAAALAAAVSLAPGAALADLNKRAPAGPVGAQVAGLRLTCRQPAGWRLQLGGSSAWALQPSMARPPSVRCWAGWGWRAARACRSLNILRSADNKDFHGQAGTASEAVCAWSPAARSTGRRAQDLRRSNFTAAECRHCNFKDANLAGTYFIKARCAGGAAHRLA